MDGFSYHYMIMFISLCFSYFFSSVETGLTAMNIAKITEASTRGSTGARVALGLHDRKNQVISAILLGNTLANIVSSSIATSILIHHLGEDFGVIVSSIVMTFTVLILAEVIPKTYAINNPEAVIIFSSRLLCIVDKILYPLTKGIGYITEALFHLLNLKSTQDHVSTTDYLRTVLDMHDNVSSASDSESVNMVSNVLDIKELEISQVMIHKNSIYSIDIALPSEEIVKQFLKIKHSRIPFWSNNPGNIIGVLHAKDMLNVIYESSGDISKIDITNLLVKPTFIPNTVTVFEQLNNFRQEKKHMAVVVDEYGDLMGIVTLEDILEEIVGDIQDEHDTVQNAIIKLSNNSYIIRGDVSIRDVNRDLMLKLNEDESSTIAGFIINLMGKIPEERETVIFKNLLFTVVKKLNNRIIVVRIAFISE